jgi:type IV pilus assembly protein PilQ
MIAAGVVLGLTAGAFLQAQTVTNEVAHTNGTTSELTLPTEETALSGGKSSSSNLISITLDSVDMADVIRMFTRLSGANIIASPSNLQGKVTVNLTEVEWKPALQDILEMHSLTLVEKTQGSGIYTIAPGTPDPLKVKTFYLRYTTVAAVEPVIRPMISPGGAISSFASKNAMIVKSTPRNLEEIEQAVLSLDRMRDQVFIEAKFLELDDGAIKDLGINWQSLEGVSLGVGNMTRSLTDSRTWNKSRSDTLAPFDTRGSVDVVNRNLNANNRDTTPSPNRTIVDTISRGQDAQSTVSDTFNQALTDMRTAVLGASDFRLILSALNQMSGVTIVSNPKILVANEEPATIHIGERERPFVSSVTPGQQGIAPIVTYNPGEAVDTGVKLMVTPTVNTESNITVRIEPELTRFVRNAVAPNNQTFPIISTKRIKTVFCLESGKTVAIGGLTDTKDTESTRKIPLLGDIPIIGKYFFSHSHKAKSQQETIIFVTVGLATPGAITETTGLPQDTELARRHLLKTQPHAGKPDSKKVPAN